MGQFVAYYRVSTVRQGVSGLGLEAQQETARSYLGSVGGALLGEFTEIETGKGYNALARRPKLRECLGLCQARKATLTAQRLRRILVANQGLEPRTNGL